MPTMSAVKQVTMPTMSTMSAVKQVTMPTMPTMSAVKQVTMPTVPAVKQVTILKENMEDSEKKKKKNLEWSYIEWRETEEAEVAAVGSGVTDGETQTAPPVAVVDKETQTSSPVIMHIELARAHSKLKHPAALAAADQLVAPLFQFNRQAPARISTSPTLRRMRSTRRIVRDFRNSVRLGCTQEEPGDGDAPSPRSPLSSLAAEGTLSGASALESRHRSMTFDNGMSCGRPSSLALQSTGNEFDFPSRREQDKEETCHDRLQGRRRSSVVVSLPGLDVSPGDLFVSNGAADILNRSTFSDKKKSKWPFSRRSTTKCKASTHTASEIEKILSAESVQDWDDSAFHKYKDCSLGEFLRDQSISLCSDGNPQDYRKQSYRKKEAIWEIFTSECVYFLDQLMVLKEVFLATLTSLQMRDCLSDVDAWRLFANLNELCLVSHDFLSSLLKVIRDSWTAPESQEGPALLELLTKAFQESICHCLQKYCLNYSSSLLYLENLTTRQDVASYVKWCEKHQQCRRLRLRDLLVAPLQRLTRYPLLLRNVRKRSEDEEEESALTKVVEQVETSICDLEGKVKWLDNYQKVKQLRDSLVWLPVWERDKRTFIPETLKHLMKAVTLENLITHRSLLYDGRLQLTENTKLHDVYLFLFDEFLLITKMKRNKKRSAVTEQSALQLVQNQELEQLLKDGCTFTVQDQPLSLDRLHLRNVDQLNASASGLPHSFIILHQNRYQQVIGAFVLQAPSEAIKRVWMSKLEGAVTALLKLDSQQPRAKSESSQI